MAKSMALSPFKPKPRAGRPVGARTRVIRAAGDESLVHLGHFAFMRAVVQGIGERESWNLYLRVDGEHSDARTVAGVIRWLRAQFVTASRKASRHGTARLLAIDVSQIPVQLAALPSLEDWAVETGWDGFSEAEVLGAYQLAHAGSAKIAAKRSRLIDKQLNALRWLEARLAQNPAAGDACAAWFAPAIGRHLVKAELFTLAQLLDRINGVGKWWWRGVPGIGGVVAARLEAWLGQHEASIGQRIGAHVLVARHALYPDELARVVKPATAIRPLEKFIVPADLDGRAGHFRQPQARCLLKAHNDHEAILAWLQAKQPLSTEAKAEKKRRRQQRYGGRGRLGESTEVIESVAALEGPLAWLDNLSHTQRAYRKEAERFLLWAILEKRKPLSSMTTEDCTAYRDFLSDPQPVDMWCGPRGRERWSPLWRPFEGPLSTSGRRYAVTVLKNLYGFLASQNYLMGNPWAGVVMPRTTGRQLDVSRSFTEKQWQFIGQQLHTLEASEKSLRLVFTLNFLYATGLRLSEAVAAKVSDLKWIAYPAGGQDDQPTEGWELSVVGKGGKLREVIVPTFMIDVLKGYLGERGLGHDINAPQAQSAHLIAPLTERSEQAARLIQSGEPINRQAGLASGTLYDMMKTFFKECARVLADADSVGSTRFAKASTHWLRHTHASHGIARGVPLEITQANLGHASLATTTVYVTTEKARRMRAMQSAWKAG